MDVLAAFHPSNEGSDPGKFLLLCIEKNTFLFILFQDIECNRALEKVVKQQLNRKRFEIN